MIHHATLCPEHPVVKRCPGVGFLLIGMLAWLHDRHAVYRQRRELLALDDRMLKDIGLSRVDALRESGKPFWRS
ncbi:MAG: DUF1127 domain-containing protein [Candidatus Competibacter sp.]|nr:DUF1127 domain-containing protein [Candidatus Competibacter sp.]MDG4583184.1 DUF1127 domain-containing protein [Candidatus Competibacter sp.]